MKPKAALAAVVALVLVAASCGADTAETTATVADPTAAVDDTAAEPESGSFDYTALRDPAVPDLPFPDNPDPDQCGIPIAWGPGGQAWLSGLWEGELIQPDVLLYDSHGRLNITGSADHGAEVVIVLFQENPVLDYYFVEVVGQPDKGWIPDHFLSFDPVV